MSSLSNSHGFLRAARLIAALTFLSRILGLVREASFSHFFGAGPLFSAFSVAFKVPNLARRLFGEGALTSSFIPIFAQCHAKQGPEAAQRLAGGVLSLLAIVLTGLVILVEVGLLVTSRFTWGPTLGLTAILMPYMVLICMTAFLGGLLNALNRFAAPALAPTILNVVLIGSIWLGGKAFGMPAEAHLRFICWSVIVAGVLQLGAQLAWLRAAGFSLNLNRDWSDSAVRRVIITTVPMIVGMSAVQINSFTDSLIALFLVPDGKGPAVLNFAQYLYNMPLGIFATALATAIFPMLAQRAAADDSQGFADTVERGLRATLFISIPAAVGLIAVATPTVRVLFEHGNFDSADTPRVARAISFYSLGIWAYAMQHILVRAYYSRHDSRTPVRIATVMVIVNVALNLMLVGPLGESGVALGTALTSFVQVGVLVAVLRARLPELRWKGTMVTAARSLVASLMMGAVIWVLGGDSPLGRVLPGGDLIRLTACIAAGALVFFAANALLGGREMRFLRRTNRPRSVR